MDTENNKKTLFLIIGLGYGDEGKGTITDYLTRVYDVDLIVRYNGGSQAAHNVVTENGIWHCFSQFGSGTLAGARTFLSEYMFVEPFALMEEVKHLEKKEVSQPLSLLLLHEDCVVVTPYHRYMNRVKELLRSQRHGSCGLGIGQAMQDNLNPHIPTIQIKDFSDKEKLFAKLRLLMLMKVDLLEQYMCEFPKRDDIKKEYEGLKYHSPPKKISHFYYNFYRDNKNNILKNSAPLSNITSKDIIFEGAQGSLLDMDYGFWPHVTPSNTIAKNALHIIERSFSKVRIHKIGITRAYSTRHGEGPFVTEDESLKAMFFDLHNTFNAWQGNLRFGWLDLVMLRYAIAINEGIDSLAVTCLDQLYEMSTIKICTAYKIDKIEKEEMKRFFEYEEKSSEFFLTKIKVEKWERHEREKLTVLLNKATPVYIEMGKVDFKEKSEQGFLLFLEKQLGSKISIISLSTRSNEKKILFDILK